MRTILVRAVTCSLVCLFILIGFYLSLLMSAESLSTKQRAVIIEARQVVAERGFASDAFLLDHFAVYRASDNWLNSSVQKETAYAATNFPFGTMTVYPDFFKYPVDPTEHAAILLHEARHLRGADEKEAYEFVWRHKEQLGWTKEKYYNSAIWKNVRRQTREYVPELFTCPANDFGDCTEPLKP